ncbi:hypothetical protein P4B35_15495 [Pontiellaceae bacterium B12227]|nr:hypothetical protein [Pontiellaceae bacterium B12227]
MSDMDFLSKEPTSSFRAVKRKGALRYIASNQRGSLGAMTQFAPPTKRLPKLLMGLFGCIDFRFPTIAQSINISEGFLKQVASLLEIPIDRIGIYVGEPNEQQKLVVTDVEGASRHVLKIAAGKDAGRAIERERIALRSISLEGQKDHNESGEADLVHSLFSVRDIPLSFPQIQTVESVCGKPAILLERIQGKQLTPEEFEAAFFEEEGSGFWALGVGDTKEISHRGTESAEYPTVGEWLHEAGLFDIKNSESLVDSVRDALAVCNECEALKMRSPLGIVHGDFAPWNVIQRTEAERPVPSTQHPALTALVAIDWEFSSADIPLIFDYAYAAWCFSELLGRTVSSIDSNYWKQLVALGVLWKELRQQL